MRLHNLLFFTRQADRFELKIRIYLNDFISSSSSERTHAGPIEIFSRWAKIKMEWKWCDGECDDVPKWTREPKLSTVIALTASPSTAGQCWCLFCMRLRNTHRRFNAHRCRRREEKKGGKRFGRFFPFLRFSRFLRLSRLDDLLSFAHMAIASLTCGCAVVCVAHIIHICTLRNAWRV